MKKIFFLPKSIFCNFENGLKSIYETGKKFKTARYAISRLTMCDFAHFGLMIFFQNVSFSMQDIEVTYQIFAKFYGFIVKYRFQI